MYNNFLFDCFISDSTFAQKFSKVVNFCYIFFGPTLGVFVPFIEHIYIFFVELFSFFFLYPIVIFNSKGVKLSVVCIKQK